MTHLPLSRAAAAMVAAALLAGPGCGPRLVTARGTVTHQGKPVVVGTVTLVAADGSMHQSGLGPDGFTIAGVPAGPCKVGVTSPEPPSAKAQAARGGDSRVPAAQPPPAGAWFPVPAKFADPATSGVTAQADGGPLVVELK